MTVRGIRASAIGLVALLAASTAGCSLRSSGYQYVRDRGTGTYLKVPTAWKVYGPDALRPAKDKITPTEAATLKLVPFLVNFDAAEKPSKNRFGALDAASAPTGIVRVQLLTAEQHDSISLGDMRSLIFNEFDTAYDAGQITVLRYEDVQLPDHFRGKRVVFTIAATDTAGELTLDQTTVVNETTRRLYILAVGCSAPCFEKNKKVIDTVVGSWTLKEI